MKQLLIAYHSQTGKNEALAKAVLEGACGPEIAEVSVHLLRCLDTGPEDLLAADALVLGTPENFGYMSGGMKDLLDRCYYPCEGKLEGRPYALFVGCGNDGRGAVAAVERIARGFGWRAARAPLILRGPLREADLQDCRDLGLAMAASLEAGII